MPSPANRNSLPFEPKSKQKKNKNNKNNPSPQPQVKAEKDTKTPTPSAVKSVEKTARKTAKEDASLDQIPEVVSKRMVRRMALFSGIPTGLGILSFFIFYVIVTQGWLEVPTSIVVLFSMGLFGLGVLGLSYGILSTSWDEDRIGTWWGWSEFTVNFSRMTSAWKSAKKEKS